jgi:hypothetical protein
MGCKFCKPVRNCKNCDGQQCAFCKRSYFNIDEMALIKLAIKPYPVYLKSCKDCLPIISSGNIYDEDPKKKIENST